MTKSASRVLAALGVGTLLSVALLTLVDKGEHRPRSMREEARARFIGMYSASSDFRGTHSLELKEGGEFTYTFPVNLWGHSFQPLASEDRSTAMSKGRWRLVATYKVLLTHTHESGGWGRSVEDAGLVGLVPIRKLTPPENTIATLSGGTLRYYYSTDEDDGRNCELTRE